MRRLKISVCMATFNGADYVTEQINSILGQLDNDDELVIVDDRSTDATLSVIREIAVRDDRIKVIAQECNIGVIRAFELAMVSSRNDLIVLSDQDDIWLSGKVEKLRSGFSEPGVSAILSNAIIFGPNQKNETFFFPPNYHPRLSVLRQLVRNDVIGCCFSFRRELLNHALPIPAFASMHDWWLGVVAISSGKVVYDSVPRIRYRRHDRNVSPSIRRHFSKILLARLGNVCAIIVLLVRRYLNRKLTLQRCDGA